jgi:hypothetical protein
VMITPTSEQSHPPAAALLAKEKDPVGLDQGCESFLLATMFPYKLFAMPLCHAGIVLMNPNARLSSKSAIFDGSVASPDGLTIDLPFGDSHSGEAAKSVPHRSR